MAEAQRSRIPHSASKQKHKKLDKLPQNAKVSKRPLLRPAIPSPYTGSSQQKVIYVSSHTPFLSAVKRVEKLLHLADKRLVQSATTNAKQRDGRGMKRKRGVGGDEILGIAEEVKRLKGRKRKGLEGGLNEDGDEDTAAGEEVVLKGTGKAIHRVLELALWFQQREQDYVVKLRTGSVGAIDDISVEERAESAAKADTREVEKETKAGAEEVDDMDVDEAQKGGVRLTPDVDYVQPNERTGDASAKKGKRKRRVETLTSDEVPETRIRYTSVVEAAVSLR